MTWLYTQWYKDYPRSSFHFFNDNVEWEQMDKYAHIFDAYSVARPLYNSYRWAGYDEKKATLHAAGIAYIFQTTIEIFDGFSAEWGFSSGDVFANTAGVGLFAAQQLIWHEQRIILKYSFHHTEYSKYRPQLLGNNILENMLKDYNGQTYWITINPKSFFKRSKIPAWLNLALGIGAEGMTGGKFNPLTAEGKLIPQFRRYRQYYLSVDIDLSEIKTKSELLKGIFKVINIIHLPSPAIEFNNGKKSKFHPLYF
jgi:hypothetical protein